MKLNKKEAEFLTALAREQNQSGCRGPAHDLLKKQVYADSPDSGPGSLAFSYDAVPLIGLLLTDAKNLHSIHEFLNLQPAAESVEWPWTSAEDYQSRLAEAKMFFSQSNNAGIDKLNVGKTINLELLPQKQV